MRKRGEVEGKARRSNEWVDSRGEGSRRWWSPHTPPLLPWWLRAYVAKTKQFLSQRAMGLSPLTLVADCFPRKRKKIFLLIVVLKISVFGIGLFIIRVGSALGSSFQSLTRGRRSIMIGYFPILNPRLRSPLFLFDGCLPSLCCCCNIIRYFTLVF